MRHIFSIKCELCESPLGIKSNRCRKTRGFKFCFCCMRKKPAEEYRCHGLNCTGKRCNKWRYADSDFCCIHEKSGERWQE